MSQTAEYNLFGVILTNGLIIRRGGMWSVMHCWQDRELPSIPNNNMTYTQVTIQARICSSNCVMFGEPTYNEDGTAELRICQGHVLKFDKLVDLRGESDRSELMNMTEEDILSELRQIGIIR